jgi:diguanylate cyclase (GGDEF)-like protein/PAS domain S-box-containing protein
MTKSTEGKSALMAEIFTLRQQVADLRKIESRGYQAEAQMAALEARNRLLGDSMPLGIFAVDAQGTITGINSKMVDMFSQLSIGDPKSLNFFTCRELTASGLAADLQRCMADREAVIATHMYEGPLGSRVHWCHHLSPVIEDDGAVSGIMAVVEDCTNLKMAEAALRESEKRYRQLFQLAPIAMVEWDVSELKTYLEGIRASGVSDLYGFLGQDPQQVHHCWKLIRTVDYNQAFMDLMGVSGRDGFDGAFIPTDSELFMGMARDVCLMAADGKATGEQEITLPTTDGESKIVLGKALVVPGHENTLGRVMIALVDISERKKAEAAVLESERRFREQAMRDGLTGLYNQRYLYQSLDELIDRAKREDTPISLVFIDLDHFKKVVDTYGHLNGSRAIREVARTINTCLEEPAYAVAYAGDEFVVVLPGWDQTQALQKAVEIHASVKRTTYHLNEGVEIQLQASLGVATFPQDADNQHALIAAADHALFTIKAAGKDKVGPVVHPFSNKAPSSWRK